MIASATLTIGDKVFRIGEEARTPRGAGTIIGLDPFADTEIVVRFPDGSVVWYSFCEVNAPDRLFTCEGCGRETPVRANGLGPCCFGKE